MEKWHPSRALTDDRSMYDLALTSSLTYCRKKYYDYDLFTEQVWYSYCMYGRAGIKDLSGTGIVQTFWSLSYVPCLET